MAVNPAHFQVRQSSAQDTAQAVAAAGLIANVAQEFDVAQRSPQFLRAKIQTGRAALAFYDSDLIGFGCYSDWESGRFVSHSGLVVKKEYRGLGLGRRLKTTLFEASKQRFPNAMLMSLTSSPHVKAMNLALGFRVVPMDMVTKDPAFWEGCKACRNYADTQARGLKCCCEAMLLGPRDDPG